MGAQKALITLADIIDTDSSQAGRARYVIEEILADHLSAADEGDADDLSTTSR